MQRVNVAFVRRKLYFFWSMRSLDRSSLNASLMMRRTRFDARSRRYSVDRPDVDLLEEPGQLRLARVERVPDQH